MKKNETESNPTYIIASSIVIAGLIIAGAVMYSGAPADSQLGLASDTANGNNQPELSIRAVDETDHIFGNPDAPIKLIEFSDLECPYCKDFHNIIVDEIIADYINTGKVAWVFRQNPLSMHKQAGPEAHATECVAELGGNDAFWTYIDRIYQVTTSNDSLDLDMLAVLAGEVGVDEADFAECQDSGRHDEKISNNIKEAIDAGATGTPYSVIVNATGRYFIIPGLVSGEQLRNALDEIIANSPVNEPTDDSEE